MKILIVEDQPFEMEILNRLLKKGNHEILTATYRNEAVCIIRENRPDMVITDTQLPILSDEKPEKDIGIEIVREARRMRPSVRTWLVSGDMVPALQAKALGYGAEKAFAKSNIKDELIASGIIPPQ